MVFSGTRGPDKDMNKNHWFSLERNSKDLRMCQFFSFSNRNEGMFSLNRALLIFWMQIPHSLLYLQGRNCIFVKICIFVLCMISLQLIFSKFLLNYWEVLLFHRWWYLLQQLCLHLSVWLFLCLVGRFEVALYRTNLLSSLVRWLVTPIHGHWNCF